MLFIHRRARGVRNIDTLFTLTGFSLPVLSLAFCLHIQVLTGTVNSVKLHSSHFASCTCKEKSAVRLFVVPTLCPNFFRQAPYLRHSRLLCLWAIVHSTVA